MFSLVHVLRQYIEEEIIHLSIGIIDISDQGLCLEQEKRAYVKEDGLSVKDPAGVSIVGEHGSLC
jgi:hypothetical protein